MTPSPYEVLQVSPTASPEEIRGAYRRLIKRWHPDRCPDHATATRRLQDINAAYEAVRRAPRPPPTPPRAPPTPPESVLWRASCRDEVIVLTSRRLLHRQGGASCDVLLSAIGHVNLRRRASAAATISVRTSDRTLLNIRLPTAQAVRLAKLLSARTR